MRGPATSLRILIVDDNADTADSLALLLRMYGHEARTAHDGPSALKGAEEFRPDAVVLDIGLPGMDGFEVAQRLRARPAFRRTLLVAASGFTRESDRCRAAEAGIDRYLVKPFDPADLEQALAACRPTREAIPA